MTKELRRRLLAVDPGLKIVPGGARRYHRQATGADFDQAAGVVCSACGQEVFRSRGGLCMPCWEKMKDEEIEVRDPRGLMSFFPHTILAQITHKSRNSLE